MSQMRTHPHNGEKLRDLRERAGLSLVQLAERTGHHPESLRNIEKNRKNASVVTLARIARALNIDIEEILVEESREAVA